MQVVLASTSKFKNQILDTVGIKHSCIDSNYDETLIKEENVYEYVKELAFGKANNIINKVSDSLIIGLDTVVYANNKILQKPKDINEAKEAIKMCKNNITSVITGISIINQKTNEIIKDYAETKITLRNIDDIDIEYYLNNEPDIMYASGFIIETIMSNFIEKIEGSYYNILGAPVETIYRHINDMGYHLMDLEK